MRRSNASASWWSLARDREVPLILHHSRFADVDRQFLDRKVLGLIGLAGSRSGTVILGTQTLEQSLDIDADLLVSDAVPADVLLQRLGRLHRHRTGTVPTAAVLDPGDWDARVTFEGKPLGAPGQGWAWVYSPLSVRETIEWVRSKRAISVPHDVREIVELATHVDHLERRALAFRPVMGEALETSIRARHGRYSASAFRVGSIGRRVMIKP